MIRNSAKFLFGDTQKIEVVGEGVRRQVMGYNDEIMLVKVWFEEGSIGCVHSHRHSQVTHVVSGEFDVNIEGEIVRMKGGDSFYIPPNEHHGAVCVKAGVLIDVFSPVREDFLGEAAA